MNRSLILYKYRSFGEYADKIILNSELYFASHTSFNDPFDCNLEFEEDGDFNKHCETLNKTEKSLLGEKTIEDYKKDLKRNLIIEKSKVGILSMSTNNKNILMWSHYADNHKGLCFGFKNDFYKESGITMSKVIYSEDDRYELIPYLGCEIEDIKRMFTLKSRYWEYEEEFRLLDLKNSYGLKRFNNKYLKEILFGCKADETNIKKIIQLCQLNGFKHVIFKKARIVPGKFELDFDELDKNKYL
ncbi:DUF2971 domain-containing protein [Arcobacter aquimarinus]|uniref:DUF2971 domain-containing protein n=1 Tax=Arcobacter aquimarinus TaxID=1315211 RepID=A0AAE7E1K3_9BACT|nr:DUF2971 domain-containing protein [Arcobacter aquimarinus]QKE27188.1 DUF2971 domain-containing protein [Arcobacter aquimarinus]RXI35138.1 hypothetical protein CP986_08320 [Arcobacter aquimarinus]